MESEIIHFRLCGNPASTELVFQMMGFWDACSGISWTICKQSAPCFRQITTPTPYHSLFTGWMLFLMLNQQYQSTEGKKTLLIN